VQVKPVIELITIIERRGVVCKYRKLIGKFLAFDGKHLQVQETGEGIENDEERFPLWKTFLL
jgi:hypothetical protein